MGQAQSNNQSSEIDTLNWSDLNTEAMTEGFRVNKNKNGLEIIDIDFNIDSESETDTINDIFHKLEQVTQQVENQEDQEVIPNPVSSESSPFISTDMYNKIMNGGANDNSSSPFVNTDVYNNIMKGGRKSDSSSSSSERDIDDSEESSTSDSDILRGLSEIDVSSEEKSSKPYNKSKKYNSETCSSEMNQKVYGFSNTSSEIIKTSDNNYYINEALTSDTPYKINSSSINSSDINLVSVGSRNGRRFL